MAEIRMEGLVKTYPGGTERATDDVSLDVADGEFVVLLGPSGCGKTTLLRMLAGLEFPDAGKITIGGEDVTYRAPQDRNLSMVFQSYAVFPHRTVRANIGFGLAMRKVPAAQIAQKVAWAAELLQLTPYLDRYPAKLSGGQRQRVAVARAIVMDADVLLMDEPLSNLDALLRLSFRAELKKIVQDLGTTTVYVTHDQGEALSLGDRVAVMRTGRIVQLGDPLEVYDRPADTFVGGFLGSPPMNFLPATVHDGQLSVAGHARPAPAHLQGHSGDLVVGVRAEHIGISGINDTDGTNGIEARVDVVEPTGSAVLLTTSVGAGPGPAVLKVSAPPTFRARPGDTVRLDLAPDALRYYDAETQLALEP
ncbi:carbohydrate ABC transporter ATP-binding protein, CUT1 family [Pseudonocardia thermophila]|jgi:ABC-type sugar transport systems, ATPase components|uniref:Carbohydrate ABC transporter ATP-binding protein, CUT1 family n=1 Tax=Pseudonocardia thermophila TaxID=1848 RepID=A0A1M6PI81_PSETH|nr:ABC transporter ATP-binding protein [Pseudonocardia thermophila]SHK07624.1 carbohydrate ABC transporter ATP-binding protein, CUT1 family [Pseudonocardia thermophila]